MKIIIVLGCEGYQENGFHFCNGIKNDVLDLEPLKGTKNYFQLIQYLDGTVKLFDGFCNKTSLISNAIYKLYELGYLDEKIHTSIGYFYSMHRKCGLLLEAKIK